MLNMLNLQRRNNSFLIRSIEVYGAKEYEVYNNSAAVYQEESGFWLFSIDKPGDFSKLCGQITRPLRTFYINDPKCFGEVTSVIPGAAAREYIQYVLDSNEYRKSPAPLNQEINIVPLDADWTDFILGLYNNEEFSNRKYINMCIEKNPGFGALINGTKTGFVMIHIDGEIGPMAITENARGKGVGSTLMSYIVPKYIAAASIGCGFVLPENVCSQRMMKKACFKPLEKNIIWVYH